MSRPLTWDTELASERAREAYRYVARMMPKDANLEVLASHEDAAIAAQRAADWQAYEEALREMMRTARREAQRRAA